MSGSACLLQPQTLFGFVAALIPEKMLSTRHEFSPHEKQMIINSTRFFARMKAEGHFRGARTNEIVAQSLLCSTASVTRIRNAYKENDSVIPEVKSAFSFHFRL